MNYLASHFITLIKKRVKFGQKGQILVNPESIVRGFFDLILSLKKRIDILRSRKGNFLQSIIPVRGGGEGVRSVT